jgi:hypothetical protein
LKKTDFEEKHLDYNVHVTEDHNVMAYVYYCMYLEDTENPIGEVARHVKQ